LNFDALARRRLLRGELPLAFFDAGGSGMPVLLQHGLCGSARQTAEAFPDDAAFRLLTLDCRGHGESPAGEADALSIANFADDVIALIESQSVAPVVLGGISMGAAIALRIAVQRPDLVRALMLVRPAWVSNAAPTNMQPNAEVGALLLKHPPAQARALFEQGATARRLEAEAPDNLASLRGFFDRAPSTTTAALLTRISADGPGVTAAQLRALTVPTLVVGSAADAIHPLAHVDALSSHIPHARRAEITPKSVDRGAHLADLHAALAAFLHEVSK
jgi:pimeloyl-ACP methyl ester carboxylesterase